MKLPPEYLIEKRQKNQQLRRWKLITLVFILAIILLLFRQMPNLAGANLFSGNPELGKSDYVARVRISGPIFPNDFREERLIKLAEDEKAKAVIIHINSPGGTVTDSEILHNAIRKIAEKKPVSIVFGTVAASGGYLAGVAGDRIFAHNGTLTGSIGVVMQTAEITELAKKIGVSLHSFKSNELKAAPNPQEKLTPEVLSSTMDIINDSYLFFRELVGKRRNIVGDKLDYVTSGRVFTGRQALTYNLIDQIGGEEAAVSWLQAEKKIDKNLSVLDYSIKNEKSIIDNIYAIFDNKIDMFAANSGLMAIYKN